MTEGIRTCIGSCNYLENGEGRCEPDLLKAIRLQQLERARRIGRLKTNTLILLIVLVLCSPPIYITEKIQFYLFEPMILFLGMMQIIADRERRIEIPSKIQSGLFFAVIAVVSIFVASVRLDGFQMSSLLRSFRLFEFFLFYYLFVRWLDIGRLAVLLNSLLVAGLISALIGIVGFLFQIPGLVAVQNLWTSSLSFNGYFRASGFTSDSSSFGAVSVLLLTISFAAFLNAQSSKSKTLCVACFCANLAALCCAFSRSGFAAGLVSLIFLSFLGLRNRKSAGRVAGSFTILLLLLFLLYSSNELFSSYVNERIAPLFGINLKNVNSISSGRVGIWAEALTPLLSGDIQTLLVGVGYKVDSIISFVDNGYLYAFVSTGILGFIGFCLMCALAMTSLFKQGKAMRSTLWFMAAGAWICFIVLMLFADTLTMVTVMCLLFILMAACDVESDCRNEHG